MRWGIMTAGSYFASALWGRGIFSWTSLHGNFYKIACLNNWNISTFCFYSFQEFECAEELWLRGAISHQLYGVAGSFLWTSLHGNFYKIAYLNNWNISTFCFYSFQEFESAEELWLRGAIPRQLNGCEENVTLEDTWKYFHVIFHKIAYVPNLNVSTLCF